MSCLFREVYMRALLFLVLIGSAGISAAVRYVATTGSDTQGTGVDSSPWASLAYAVTQVEAGSGDTILLGEGTFNDNLADTIVTVPSGVSLLGSGKDKTTYVGTIRIPETRNVVIADMFLDGRKNTEAQQTLFEGLFIQTGDNVEVRDLRIEGFWSGGLMYGRYSPGMTSSSLHHCELINNGKATSRGFGMRTGDLTDVDIHHVTFIEEEGKGGEPWNTGNRTFTNVRLHNLAFTTHQDKAAGWNNQTIFNIELWHLLAYNVSVYECAFDGSVSLVLGDHTYDTSRADYSIRLHHNKWSNTRRYGIEASMPELVIDSNYFHLGGADRPGYGAVVCFASDIGPDHIRIHHNVVENVPLYAFHNLIGNNVHIHHNTVIAATRESTAGFWATSTGKFLTCTKDVAVSGWRVHNNLFVNPDSGRAAVFFSLGDSIPAPSGMMMTHNAVFQADTLSRAFSSTGGEVGTFFRFDPLFLEQGGRETTWFSLRPESPAIDTGVSIPRYNDGFAGEAPDLGAYEYVGPVASGLVHRAATTPSRRRMAAAIRQFDVLGRAVPGVGRSGPNSKSLRVLIAERNGIGARRECVRH